MEIEKKQINETDYIDITVFIRSFLRLARRYLLLICPLFICLTASLRVLPRVIVKEQYIAEASFAVGVKLTDDFSYNYTLQEIEEDYVIMMSEAFKSVLRSEYIYDLLERELGISIPGDIIWEGADGTNMGRIYILSDSMEDAVQLRDAVIKCLPEALFTSIGDVEIKVLGTSEQTEISHGELTSPLVRSLISIVGSIAAYLGIVFLLMLFRHDIESPEDMAKITDLPCLGSLPKTRKKISDEESKHNRSDFTADPYSRSFSEFRRQLADVIEEQQVKTLLFTGGYKKRGQAKIIDKLSADWTSQGKKIRRIDMDLSKGPKPTTQIQEELNQQIKEALEDVDLLIINGPDYEQTVELLSAADCVDGIVYIVRAGYDQFENTKEAVSTLGFTQAKFLGYVITA